MLLILLKNEFKREYHLPIFILNEWEQNLPQTNIQ